MKAENRPRPCLRWAIIECLVTLLADSWLCGCGGTSDAKTISVPEGQVWLTTTQASASKVQVEPIMYRDVTNVLTTPGSVSFDDQRLSHVYCPVTGKIVRILATLGQHVARGEPLALVDSPDVGLASAELNKAKADLQAAEHEFARQQDLFASQASSQREFEQAESARNRARAEVQRAVDKARLLRGWNGDTVSQYFVLRAPIEGDVLVRNVTPGMEIQGQYAGGSSAELFTIGNGDPVWVQSDVPARDVGLLRLGATAEVQVISHEERRMFGNIDFISKIMNRETQTARVRITLPNKDHDLKPEMFANVRIQVPGTRMLALPKSAVLHLGETAVVYVQLTMSSDGRQRFERRPVQVDETLSDQFLPVVHGVSVGEQVVIKGAENLSAQS